MILRGAAMIQVLKPLEGYSIIVHCTLIPYISTKLKDAKSLDIVWDTNSAESLQNAIRKRHEKGIRSMWQLLPPY